MKEKIGTKLRIQIRNKTLFNRVRKGVWKEKELDPTWVIVKDPDGTNVEVKRKSLYIVHCEFIKEDGIMIFFVSEKLTHEDV